MRVIVLGSKGQLGSDVASVLETGGVSVIRVTREKLDASSPHLAEQLKALPQADFIVNCYAFVNVDAAETASADAFQVNATFPYFLAQHCERHGIKLIHISTDFVFRGDLGRAYNEDDAVGPVNVYGLSKAAGEAAVMGSCRDCCVLRVSGLYGVAGSGSKGGNFVETMVKIARRDGKVRVVEDQFTSPTHTLDVARAILKIVTNKDFPKGLFHCSNKGTLSWFDFAAAIIKNAAIPAQMERARLKDFNMVAPRPVFSALRTNKLDFVFVMPDTMSALKEYLRLKNHV